MALLVYINDIVLTGASLHQINLIKEQLSAYFKLKDLGKLQHFFGLQIAKSPDGIVIYIRQYVLNLLEDTCFLAAKPTQHLMDPSCKASNFEGAPLTNLAY